MEIKEFELYTNNLSKYSILDIEEMTFMDEEELKNYEYQVEDCSGTLSDWDHCRAILTYKKRINEEKEKVKDLEKQIIKLKSELI